MKAYSKHVQRLQTVLLIVAVFTLGFIVGNLNTPSQAQGMGDKDQLFSAFEQAVDLIRSRYVDARDIELPALIDGAIKGMVDSLEDPFSGYLNAKRYATYINELSGDVEGIGVVIRTIEETGEIVVVSLIRGAAAAAAGVLPGDIFWEVDGKSVKGMNQSDLAAIVRGPAGTNVTITFKRGEEFVTFTITRVRFQVPTVEYQVLDGDIVHITLSEFNGRARQQLEEAIRSLDVNNRAGLILDIRDNPGGLLTSVVDISSLFIERGVILYEAFGDGSEQVFEANGRYLGITVPIVLLVNEGSASASELLAGAFKDRGVGTIVGETTFGKGTVQTLEPLSNGGALRLTIARWLTPNRNWIHDFGIAPDVEVPYDPAAQGSDTDPQLEKAIEIIKSASK